MKSTLIDYVNGKAIVKLEKAGHIEWLACNGYDDSKSEGSKWSSADYFLTLIDAVKSAMSHTLYHLSAWNIESYASVSAVFESLYDIYDYLKSIECPDVSCFKEAAQFIDFVNDKMTRTDDECYAVLPGETGIIIEECELGKPYSIIEF